MKERNITDKTESCTIRECGVIERPRYFSRQLITDKDLSLDQDYFRNKLRRHNRLLHGWGVVCGAKVCPVFKAKGGTEAWKVKIMEGYILGPYGDEIVIDCERIFDLRMCGINGDTPECLPDPWCNEEVEEEQDKETYIAVKYTEDKTRPVRVQPVGCGCDESQCEYSRWRDGYEIGCLKECPCSHIDLPEEEHPEDMLCKCPPCPPDPWLVLAKVTCDAKSGTIKCIDNCECRRMVKSYAHYWWKCTADKPEIVEVCPDCIQRDEEKEIIVHGENFHECLKVDAGEGILVKGVRVTDNKKITVTVCVDKNAKTGPRTLTITNPDCSTGTGEMEVCEKERDKMSKDGSPSYKKKQQLKTKKQSKAE